MSNKLFEALYSSGKKIAPSFSEFREIYERTDFSDVDKKKLNDIYLWGDESSLFDNDKSLMQALNIDTEDETLMPKIAAAIPAYASYFSPDAAKKTRAIDLINAQVEFIKVKVSEFENALLSTLTGKEEKDEYESKLPGMKVMTGAVNINQELINSISKTFSRVTDAPLKASIDQFVATDEGKATIKLLEEMGARSASNTVVDNLFKKAITKLGEMNLDVPMKSADNTDMVELTNENVELKTDIDYISSTAQLSELELMQSMDPFVRLGLFYQLCIQQQKDFSDRVMPSSGKGINYSDMLRSGNVAEESLKILFGRDLDFGGVQNVISSLSAVSQNVMKLKWESPESDDVRGALFVPAMQVVYVAMLNFVIMKALYVYLTKKTEIVSQVQKQKASEIKVNQTLSGLVIPDFTDPKVKTDKALRYKTAISAIRYLKGQGFFEDTKKLYYEKGKELNPEAITALKILMASIPQIEFTEKVPMKPEEINGTWTPELKSAVMQLQKVAGIKADGIIGPNTRKAIIGIEETIKEKYPTV